MVYRPTARVLTVLELLQSHGRMTGAELARRLEVNIRTVRDYIEMLGDLGIPVEAERGFLAIGPFHAVLHIYQNDLAKYIFYRL